jgi:hypothetical protein
MFRPFVILLACVPMAAHAQVTWERDGSRVQTVIYTCDSAMDALSVAYFTAPDAINFAAVQIGGVVHALVQDVAASDLRYVDVNEQTGYRLQGKGEQVMLLKREPDHTAEEQLLADCRAM